MDYTADPDGPSSNEHPNSHDYDQLVAICSHSEAPAAPAKTSPPPAMTDLDLEGPGQWGRLIRSTNGDQTELYEPTSAAATSPHLRHLAGCEDGASIVNAPPDRGR
jgi:hypothetical protein